MNNKLLNVTEVKTIKNNIIDEDEKNILINGSIGYTGKLINVDLTDEPNKQQIDNPIMVMVENYVDGNLQTSIYKEKISVDIKNLDSQMRDLCIVGISENVIIIIHCDNNRKVFINGGAFSGKVITEVDFIIDISTYVNGIITHSENLTSNVNPNCETFLTKNEVIDFYENGKCKHKYSYIENIEFGVGYMIENFYENGSIKNIGYWAEGKRVGKFILYYENGRIESIDHYKGGELDGICESWYDNGGLKELANYKEGQRDGLFIALDEIGRIKEKSVYNNGIIDLETTSKL